MFDLTNLTNLLCFLMVQHQLEEAGTPDVLRTWLVDPAAAHRALAPLLERLGAKYRVILKHTRRQFNPDGSDELAYILSPFTEVHATVDGYHLVVAQTWTGFMLIASEPGHPAFFEHTFGYLTDITSYLCSPSLGLERQDIEGPIWQRQALCPTCNAQASKTA